MAWLGKASSTSSMALKSLPHLEQQYRTMSYRAFATEHIPKRLAHLGKPFVKTYDHELRGLAEIFQRQYWRTVWIIQEFILPQIVLLVCGADVVDCEQLESALIVRRNIGLAYQKLRTEEGKQFNVLGSASDILLGRWKVSRDNQKSKTSKRETNMSLHDTIYMFHRWERLECEDPRDHLYGLMGLVRQEEKLPADYSKPANIVYCEMLQRLEASQLTGLYNGSMYHLGMAMQVTGEEDEISQKPALMAFKSIFGHGAPWAQFGWKRREIKTLKLMINR